MNINIINGTFTKNELLAIMDYCNGIMLPNTFDVKDFIYDDYFDNMIIKYQLDESIYKKAEGLSDVQMNELRMLILNYWSDCATSRKKAHDFIEKSAESAESKIKNLNNMKNLIESKINTGLVFVKDMSSGEFAKFNGLPEKQFIEWMQEPLNQEYFEDKVYDELNVSLYTEWLDTDEFLLSYSEERMF